MSNSPSKGTALITGAPRGIGARLKALSARPKSETGSSITPLPADLNGKTDLAKV